MRVRITNYQGPRKVLFIGALMVYLSKGAKQEVAMFRIIIRMMFIITSTVGSARAIDVSGDVWGEWGPGNNPYLVTGDLRVPPESSLTILPGCRIEFQGHYKFAVDSLALLQVIGNETDSIVFTNPDTLEGWNGIRLYWADSSCAFSYCRLEWGRAGDHYPDPVLADGGAVHCVSNALSIQNCLFRFNRAWEGYGGAIYTTFSRLEVRNSTLIHNRCGFGGAAVYASSSDILIEGCDVSSDTTFYALGGEYGGGAVGCWYSDVVIRNSIIAGNLCGQSGGGLSLGASHAFVEGNIIRDNVAWYFGGGLGVGGAPSLVSNNLIINNRVGPGTACSGGGVACGNGAVLVNNTIVGNHSGWFGGGIRYYTSSTPDTFENNIIWGNVAWQDSQIMLWDNCPSPVMLYSDIQGGWPGAGNIDADPLFRNAANGDFHLMALACGNPQDSPCIDTGHPNIYDDSLACDFGLGAARSDMGAYGGGGVNPDAIYESPNIPDDFVLLQNYPNPFNSRTMISFSLPEAGDAALEIFDILGRRVETLYQGRLVAEEYSVTWDAKDSPSGVYFYRLKAGEAAQTRRMMLVK